MVAVPLDVPRVDETARLAIARADRDTPRPHGYASVREMLVARHGERPADPLIRMMLRLAE